MIEIWFIDDKRGGEIARYRAALEKTGAGRTPRWEVRFADDAAKAVESIRRAPHARVLITDMIMPSPKGHDDDTTVGLWVIEQLAWRIQKESHELPLRVIVLTGGELESVRNDVSDMLGRHARHCTIVSKSDCDPLQLVQYVEDVLDE